MHNSLLDCTCNSSFTEGSVWCIYLELTGLRLENPVVVCGHYLLTLCMTLGKQIWGLDCFE